MFKPLLVSDPQSIAYQRFELRSHDCNLGLSSMDTKGYNQKNFLCLLYNQLSKRALLHIIFTIEKTIYVNIYIYSYNIYQLINEE